MALDWMLLDSVVRRLSVQNLTFLIANRADVNYCHYYSFGLHDTPLTLAAERGTIKHIHLLLDSGADILLNIGNYKESHRLQGFTVTWNWQRYQYW
jgi:hypothetical protein